MVPQDGAQHCIEAQQDPGSGMASSLPWAASLLQTPPSKAPWACEGPGVSSAAGPLLRKCLVPIQFVGKDPPLVGSTRPSQQPTLEPRSAHFSLFQELNAQTASLPPLPKHVCFVLSPEGSLGRWPGLCLEGEGEGALESDLPRDAAWLCSDPHKVLPYCGTQTQVRKMPSWSRDVVGREAQCGKEWECTSWAYFVKNFNPHLINRKK